MNDFWNQRFAEVEFAYGDAELVERELEEGPYHRGMSAFVHVLANKTSNKLPS